ncbi:hypothetical protein HanXRQr2_Chr02g0050091 [Helianthus annuus]|uniref:Uncharacterized protein n=1 Tax=Helianthus annuus TaxID=4232 RepID=A0A9K3NXQ6_HELAN|nr:hypothetical protein HanXRQr2_Chr02g0050091 [Helianthus annuus]KAJ0950548.1 hypothetical protein HanPSC8_Chr02g0049511 [Helianthus annuus]
MAFSFMLDMALSLNESFLHVYLLNVSSSVKSCSGMGRKPRAGNEDEIKPGVVNLISFWSRFMAAHSFRNVHSVDASTTVCEAHTPSACYTPTLKGGKLNCKNVLRFCFHCKFIYRPNIHM